jgi:signal transduction histidine kinase
VPIGRPVPIEPNGVSGQVLRTGQPTGLLEVSAMRGISGDGLRRMNMLSVAGSPVIVEGRLWGALCFAWNESRPQLSNLGARMTGFTDLAATAIANAYSRAELAASRARLVVAADETRRQIERDLHDGTQQRLVSIAMSLGLLESKLAPNEAAAVPIVREARTALTLALEELRELTQGIHPTLLVERGLPVALEELCRRAGLPAHLTVDLDVRLPDQVETAAYYFASEALSNAVKHSHGSEVRIEVAYDKTTLTVEVTDDGIGGAAINGAGSGSGLRGLADRVEALGGQFTISSPPGRGTRLRAEIPCA